jgi:hypothetical protein
MSVSSMNHDVPEPIIVATVSQMMQFDHRPLVLLTAGAPTKTIVAVPPVLSRADLLILSGT